MPSPLLSSASLDGLSLSERAYHLAELVSGCRWMADALEKSMSTNLICEGDDVDTRTEAVSRLVADLLHLASDHLFELHGDLDDEKLMRRLAQSLQSQTQRRKVADRLKTAAQTREHI
jgi:hypothetical protein